MLLDRILRKLARQKLQEINERHRKSQLEQLPRFRLRPKNVQGGIIIADREALLQNMPSHGIVAEIGVDEGKFSEKIKEINKPKKLHLIDTWGSKRYNDDKAQHVFDTFRHDIDEGSAKIHRKISTDAAHEFPDEYFDWIYIDTTHSYPTTISELYAFSSKVKPSGFIAGHDYTMGNWRSSLKYGVIEAVAEFCTKEDWKLAYWTADFTEGNSFAITRINQ